MKERLEFLAGIAGLLVAVVGAIVCMVVLRRREKRQRVTKAARVAAEMRRFDAEDRRRAAELIADIDRDLDARAGAPTSAVDPNPTRRISALDAATATGTQWLRPDLGQPTRTLPPVTAPTRPVRQPAVPPPVDPIPRVPVDDDAPTPFAPTWKPTPADPDHWQKVVASPGDPTPLCPPVPVAPPEADWSHTQAFERGRLFRILGNARRDELDALRRDMENGAQR